MTVQGELARFSVSCRAPVIRGGLMWAKGVADPSGVALDIVTRVDEPRFRALTREHRSLDDVQPGATGPAENRGTAAWVQVHRDRQPDPHRSGSGPSRTPCSIARSSRAGPGVTRPHYAGVQRNGRPYRPRKTMPVRKRGLSSSSRIDANRSSSISSTRRPSRRARGAPRQW